LFLALVFVFSSHLVFAQSNPEYDGIIVEAQKTGKDPLEVAQEKKKNGEWDIKRYIDFSKYNRNIQEQAVIIEDKKNNGKRQE
jgi:lipopolysaccharide export LptBFGC system permease protein LptF